ncbi:hypothetical protein [Pseudoalteromonas translucida]|uniref:Uncharacterized protein n=1 Tax=Pseudoalteromonas translucida (strain TAC 125) TaxID=326442 RepID=Q3IGM9_PSET1|nr:hypothetical protein [Pseudoalteromonas translucida]CAI86630.1 conserved protein of unknown function [Pseudoalteromonas translucida]
MAAFTASQASVTNGSKVVTINSGESIANVRQGDFLFLAGFLVEINRGYVGAASQQYIGLVKKWANSNQSSQPAVVIPTTGDFRAAVDAINNANKNVNDNFVAMQNWQTNMGSVTFTNQDGTTTTVKTLKQIEADNEAQMDTYHPYPWAMRKVEFEANRAQNNEKFAASGFVHFGKHWDNSTPNDPINEGLYTDHATPNLLLMGRGGADLSVKGDSKTINSILNLAGVITPLKYLSLNASGGRNTIKLPPAEDGKRTYDSASGLSVTHTTSAIAFASETATNKVVTDRVDMWGFEAYLREVNDADPFVYANGLIQSLATSISGVTTVSDNVRPITYFAWYEGDEDSRGKGVNWQTASEAQRIKLASDPANNIYFDDATGKFYQWCIRGRSFAGLGNGDWLTIDSTSSALAFSTINRVGTQGTRAAPRGWLSSGADTVFYGNNPNAGVAGTRETGLFTVFKGLGEARDGAEGHCYFYVGGTVNRLNQGAYHPSFNHLGAAGVLDTAGVSSHEWFKGTARKLNGKSMCFSERSTGARSGAVGSTASRPDGRFYDVIYASGLGGVCRDMRYSAWGLTKEDFAKADLSVKSDRYRGMERLKITKVADLSEIESVSSSNGGIRAYQNYAQTLNVDVTDGYYVYNKETGAIFYNFTRPDTLVPPFSGHIYYPISWGLNPKVVVIYSNDSDIVVSGDFMHTEVVCGNPEKLLQCEDLKDGWVGEWNPTPIIEGTPIPHRRKVCNTYSITDPKRYVNGVWDTWASSGSIKNTSNLSRYGLSTTNYEIYLFEYSARAYRTIPSKVPPILGHTEGVGQVWITSRNRTETGANVVESLIGKVPTKETASSTGKDQVNYPLTSLMLGDGLDTMIGVNKLHSTHSVADIYQGEIAVKALNYNVVENQQGFINYAYTELKHNGTDWGDDGKIHIVDNQSTMLDTNGQTVKVGTARIVEPLGWIKNDK